MDDVLDLIEGFGEKEKNISYMEFISPVYNNDTVIMSMDGIVLSFKISWYSPGWHRFKPVDYHKAQRIREAELSEIESYLRKLPQIRVCSGYRKDNIIYGYPLKNNKIGILHNNLVQVYLPDDQPLDFDRILCRFDGVNLWYEGLDSSNDPTKSNYLRMALSEQIYPDKIRYSGLTLEERASYALRYSHESELKRQEKMKSIQGQVEYHGGKLLSCNERQDHLEVEIEVEGQRFTTYVSKGEGHRVISAGICLEGMDKEFDLTSLVSVYKEGMKRDLIYRLRH